ncbi:unnamed protein product, partial [marine sediment metagenome]
TVLAREMKKGERELMAYFTRKEKVELWPSIAEFFVYDDVVYRSMSEDEIRNKHYKASLNKFLKGKRVVEIGPGPDAVLSRFCIEAGAEKVYAVEILKETYEKAKDRIESLGLEDKIILINGDITETALPEKVDYCVSEIVGSIGGSEGAARLINKARRFLHDPSCMIPRRSLTKIAAISLSEDDLDYSFSELAGHYVDKIFDQAGHKFDFRICLKNLSLEKIISTSDVFEDL